MPDNAALGPLEQRILNVLWSTENALSVRDVLELVSKKPKPAYTTVMTVLDRLFAKGLVKRQLVGRSHQYRPSSTRAQYLADRAARTLAGAPDRRAVVMAFLESASRTDPELLVELASQVERHAAEEGSK